LATCTTEGEKRRGKSTEEVKKGRRVRRKGSSKGECESVCNECASGDGFGVRCASKRDAACSNKKRIKALSPSEKAKRESTSASKKTKRKKKEERFIEEYQRQAGKKRSFG